MTLRPVKKCCATCRHGGFNRGSINFMCRGEGERNGLPARWDFFPCASRLKPLGDWEPRTTGPIRAIVNRTARSLVPDGSMIFWAAMLIMLAWVASHSHDTIVWLGVPPAIADHAPTILLFWAGIQTVMGLARGASNHLYEACAREMRLYNMRLDADHARDTRERDISEIAEEELA